MESGELSSFFLNISSTSSHKIPPIEAILQATCWLRDVFMNLKSVDWTSLLQKLAYFLTTSVLPIGHVLLVTGLNISAELGTPPAIINPQINFSEMLTRDAYAT